MSNLAIDQLLQITTPAPPAREASSAPSEGGDRFRAHLDRATEVSEAKPSRAKEDDEPTTAPTDEPIEAQTEQRETSTSDQDEAAAVGDASEPTSEVAEDTPPSQDSEDEVTLSSVAAQTTETVDAAERAAEAQSVIDATFTDGQQNSDGQSAQQPIEATANLAAGTTESETTFVETAAPAATTTDEAIQEITASEIQTETTAADGETQQSQVFSTENSSAIPVESSSTKTTTTSSQDQQVKPAATSTQTAQQNLPENSADQHDEQPSSKRQPTPSPSLAVEAEPLLDADATAALEAGPDTNSNSQPTTTASRATEALAAVGKPTATSGSSQNATVATRSSDAPADLPTVDRSRFVQRVSGAIRSAQQRDGQIQLRLSPPELGTLKIQLTVNEGTITAHLETENAAARSVLLDNLPALRERLAEQEITIEKFDVDVGQDEKQQTDNPTTDEKQSNRDRAATEDDTTGSNDRQTSNDDRPRVANSTTTNIGLDVRI